MVERCSFQHLYPFKSHYLNLDGYHTHYLDEGKQNSERGTLLMLHGNPTWSFYYRNLISRYSKHFRVIAPDHIGCGLSDKPEHYPYTLSTHIKNLERLATYLNLQNITLIVHDWGGPIGFGYAVRHAEKIKKIIVLNSAAFLGESLTIPFRIRLCHYPFLGDFIIRRLNFFAKGALTMAVRNKKLTPDVKAGYLAPYPSYASRVALLRFVQDIPWHTHSPSYPLMMDIQNKLPLINTLPMLILWGEKDFCFTHSYLKRWLHFFPQARAFTFAKAGHYVLEDALPEITSAIDTFLRARV